MIKTIRMTVIPEPKPNTRIVMVLDFKGPMMKGTGSLNYVCGVCGDVMLEGIAPKQVQNIVIKCFGCGVYNSV